MTRFLKFGQAASRHRTPRSVRALKLQKVSSSIALVPADVCVGSPVVQHPQGGHCLTHTHQHLPHLCTVRNSLGKSKCEQCNVPKAALFPASAETAGAAGEKSQRTCVVLWCLCASMSGRCSRVKYLYYIFGFVMIS